MTDHDIAYRKGDLYNENHMWGSWHSIEAQGISDHEVRSIRIDFGVDQSYKVALQVVCLYATCFPLDPTPLS